VSVRVGVGVRGGVCGGGGGVVGGGGGGFPSNDSVEKHLCSLHNETLLSRYRELVEVRTI